MIPLVREHPDENNPDIVFELRRYLSILFKDQDKTDLHRDFMRDLDILGGDARIAVADEGGFNTDEKFEQFKAYVEELQQILEKYVPQLLKKESFFTKVFP